MSLISSIQNSRGRFKKKRRSNKTHDARKQKSAKKAVVTAKQKHIEDANERQGSGNGEELLRMKRLREERELEQGHDEENTISTQHVPGDASLTQTESEENRDTAEVGGVVAQRVQVGQSQDLSVEPGEEASSAGEAPCAVEEKADKEPSEEDGFFSDLFQSVVAEEVSPTVALAASLPDIPAQELLDEAEEIKTLLQRRGGVQK